MESRNNFRQNLLVWTVILGLFSFLTVLAVNLDRIRDSSFFKRRDTGMKSVQHRPPIDVHHPENAAPLNLLQVI